MTPVLKVNKFLDKILFMSRMLLHYALWYIFFNKGKGRWYTKIYYLLYSIDLSSGQEDDFEADNNSNRKEDGENLEALGAILSKQTKHVVNNSMYYEFQVPEKLTTKPNPNQDVVVQEPKQKVTL